ncbi:MAG: hypothetical protein P8L68_11855 [Paracoccaceae bacterium]|nr:hypothetical protein [Paracoccaceae bacterium]MDG2259178.1 hypothetical protein [Paracoccaceae bacterium]
MNLRRYSQVLFVSAAVLASGQNASAQETLRPLSAIDWFNQNLTENTKTPPTPEPELHVETTSIDVSILAPATPDSVGLISNAVSGFAPVIWSESNSSDLDTILMDMTIPRVPALSILLTRLMLTEAEGPQGPAGSFLHSRVSTLTRLGDVEPALALLERADPEENVALFQQWADLKILHGEDRELCDLLAEKPNLTPGYDYQVYCLSRSGDWPTAATTLLAAEVLGELRPELVLLLTRYLDPEIFEGMPVDFEPEDQLSPLEFRLMEGVGASWPTDALPLAFAHSDLRGLVGWRAQITAAERLARTGAVSENRLLGIYTANEPSASGGVWDRVADIQALEDTLSTSDAVAIGSALTSAWSSFDDVGLRFVLANLYGDRLGQIDWNSPELATLAHEVALLSRTYQGAANSHWPTNHRQAFLDAVAIGSVKATTYEGVIPDAIRNGFSNPPSLKYTNLLSRNADGEALLMAISSVAAGRDSFPSDISDAIAVFRVLGLSETARQFSLQLMLSQS